MKKGLTILTSAIAATALFGCKSSGKVTGIKIQALPYTLNHKWYKVGLTVDGEGKYSSNVRWTTSDSRALVTSDCYFNFSDSTLTDNVEVEITATSIENNKVSATAKITVLAASGLEITDFVTRATAGDTARKAIEYNEINAESGEDDFIYVNNEYVHVESAKYKITPVENLDMLIVKSGDITKSKPIPKAEKLRESFENQFKDCVSCFEFTEQGRGGCYGYYIFCPSYTEKGEDYFVYCVFQDDGGLPVYNIHIEGDICYSYLNLTPQIPE